jgi:hypothetical protein
MCEELNSKFQQWFLGRLKKDDQDSGDIEMISNYILNMLSDEDNDTDDLKREAIQPLVHELNQVNKKITT